MTTEPTAESPSLASQLKAVLPPWTHHRTFFGFDSTWTTPEGTWNVAQSLFSLPTISGPFGSMTVPASRVVPILEALGALDFRALDYEPATHPTPRAVVRVTEES